MIFDLVQDFGTALEAMPLDHVQRCSLALLHEAIRRDVNFIDQYPTALFQCFWNSCWWYDCPDLALHCEATSDVTFATGLPTRTQPLFKLVEDWERIKRESACFPPWLKSLRPPKIGLDSGLIAEFKGFKRQLLFSPNGTQLAILGLDVLLFDTQTGIRQLTLESGGRIKGIGFAADGQQILGLSYAGSLYRWDAQSGALVDNHNSITLEQFQGVYDEFCHASGMLQLVGIIFSIDGQRVAIPTRDSIQLWHTNTGKRMQVLPHDDVILSIAFSSNGEKLAASYSSDIVQVWDLSTGKMLLKISNAAGEALSFSPDDRILAGGIGSNIRLWDAVSGSRLSDLNGHDSPVLSLAFSPDGSSLASGSGAPGARIGPAASSPQDTSVQTWDVATGVVTSVFRGHPDCVTGMQFSADGKLASGSLDGTVLLWNSRLSYKCPTIRNHGDAINRITFSPDGRHVASASGYLQIGGKNEVCVWDSDSGKRSAVYKGSRAFLAVAFSPIDTVVAAGGDSKQIALWDFSTENSKKVLTVPSFGANCLGFSPDGAKIAVGCAEVHVLDVATGAIVTEMKTGEPIAYAVAYSPDGSQVFVALNTNIIVYDAVTGKVLRAIESSARDACELQQPSKKLQAFGNDGITTVWEVESNCEVAWFPREMKAIHLEPTRELLAGAVRNEFVLLRLVS